MYQALVLLFIFLCQFTLSLSKGTLVRSVTR